MAASSGGESCRSGTSSACCAEAAALALQLRGGWAEARDSTEVLRLAHALAAPLDDNNRDGGAGPLLHLRLRCDEGPPVHALPRGVLSPYANAVCMVAQALRLGGGRPAPGAPPLHALDVAMPEWAQAWECATVAVAFAWSLGSAPGPLRCLTFRLPPPLGLQLLEPQYAAALREALRMRQGNERLALLMGTHKRLGADCRFKLLPPDLLARIFSHCACTLRLSPAAATPAVGPVNVEADAGAASAGCDAPALLLDAAEGTAPAAALAARRQCGGRARGGRAKKAIPMPIPIPMHSRRCSRDSAALARDVDAAAVSAAAEAGCMSDGASVDGTPRRIGVPTSPASRRRSSLQPTAASSAMAADCGESRGC